MQPRKILLLNTLGLLLVATWWLTYPTVWSRLDDGVFWFFNQFVTADHRHWTEVLAFLNLRIFDAIAFVTMALLFFVACLRDSAPERIWRWFGIGLTMLVTAALLALFTTKGIRYGHPSPTLVFENAHRLTDIVTIPAKDASANSFPGDHGLMLMVFASFMLRFSDRMIGALSVAFVVLLSAPRIMVGAHWFSDVYMGALAIALVVLPWVLYTPLATCCVGRIVTIARRICPSSEGHRYTQKH
ncbi:phosphatase PAP2 family protein [Halomonas shantousis]